MKQYFYLFAFLLLCNQTFSQKPKITWGEEFKMKKGSTDLDVVYADNTGVFLQESHLAMSYFVIGTSSRTSATLVKLDKNLAEVFKNDFNRELKGKEFEQFFVLQDKVFIVASDYSRKEKTLAVYVAEVNKNTGDLSGDWQQLTSFQKEEKKDEINFKLSFNADSTKMVVVSSVTRKEKNTYQVQEFDKSLKSTGKPVTISNEFDPKTFQLEDVLYTINKKIILVGRIYQYQEGKRKKDKFLDFENYNIRIYNEGGKQQTEVNTTVNGKWLISTKLLQEKNRDLVMAAFYSKNKKDKTIDGMLVQRIDPETGKVLSTSEKEINNSMLTTAVDDSTSEESKNDESRAERREREKLDKIKDEGEGFSKYMQFHNIFYTEDNGLVILAEKYHHYTYTTQSYSPGTNGSPGTWSSITHTVFECGDVLMTKVDAAGNISWLQLLPKAQREVIGGSYGNGLGSSINFFDLSNRPFYAGFGAIQSNGYIYILFNDNPKNANVTQPGQRVKTTNRFGNSDCYIITLKESTGKYTRSEFFSNKDVPTSMPRLGNPIGDIMYITGKEDRMLGRTKIAVAKITVN